MTPPDTLLEKLMDELIASGRAYYDSWLEKDDAVRAARAALREYVSATTLTEDEATMLIRIIDDDGYSYWTPAEQHANHMAITKLHRRASMKEHPE